MVWTISSTKLKQLGKFSSQGFGENNYNLYAEVDLSVCRGKNKKKQPLLCRVWVKPYFAKGCSSADVGGVTAAACHGRMLDCIMPTLAD